MSNIKPVSDPAIATALVATFESIRAVHDAPAGLSQTRWRILQCIGKAVPFVPSAAELRLCSGLSKAALAENLQGLRWKGLIELDGYQLSPSALAMLGVTARYPVRGKKGTVVIDEAASFAPIGKAAPDPADVPACMRPDCSPPKIAVVGTETRDHGRGGAAVAHPYEGAVRCDRVATDHITDIVVGSNPAPGQPVTPHRTTNWIAERQRRLTSAIAHLKAQAILVSVVDRDAAVRKYWVAGKRHQQFAEEVIEHAMAKGWAE